MKHQPWIVRIVVVTLAFALCGAPQVAMAYSQDAAQQSQQQTAGSVDQQQQPAQQPSTQQSGQQEPGQRGTTVDPSQGPLTPVPSQQLPEAPSSTAPQNQPAQQPATAPTGGQQQQPKTSREPLGAAAAEGIKTAGGGASRPAGSAIAPAKQRQVRSFLVKVGLIAAAGAAIGTVYALSRGTPSTPPNSGR